MALFKISHNAVESSVHSRHHEGGSGLYEYYRIFVVPVDEPPKVLILQKGLRAIAIALLGILAA
jgi:hypothetical protein